MRQNESHGIAFGVLQKYSKCRRFDNDLNLKRNAEPKRFSSRVIILCTAYGFNKNERTISLRSHF